MSAVVVGAPLKDRVYEPASLPVRTESRRLTARSFPTPDCEKFATALRVVVVSPGARPTRVSEFAVMLAAVVPS